MKIYEIRWHTGERSWICANTVIEALKVYCAKKNTSFDEFDGMDDVVTLSKFKLAVYKTKDSQSFSQYMRTAVVPDVIAESFLNDISGQCLDNKTNDLIRVLKNEFILLQNI